MAWLAHQCAQVTVRRAAGLGWLFGTAWLGASTWWLFISMHRFGGLPAWLAACAVALLSAALALYLACAMAGYARWRTGRASVDAPLFAAMWVLAELARSVLFTGFPWAATGYAQVDAPLAAAAPWVGVVGLGALCALLSVWLATAWQQRAPKYLALVGVVLALGTLGPSQHTQASRTLQVSLIQTNVAQDEKFALEHMAAALAWLGPAMVQAPGDLVVVPETAVPLLPEQLDDLVPGFWAALTAHFASAAQHALVGLPLGNDAQGYTNSVVGLGPGASYRYDKTHLVPFGEFIPSGFRWFTQMMDIPLGDFNRGVRNAPSFEVLGERVAPNICYEDLFGDELALRFLDADQAPTVFANVSNIAWFGHSIALPQHLNISRLRTLEFQRPMLRATNTGATAVIDHQGRVTQQLAPYTRGVLSGAVQGRHGLTPFAWWAARLGLWPWLVLALGVVLCCARLRARAQAQR